jgi:hypothetical protein
MAALSVVESAAACPVCFSSGNDESRVAFIFMTGFLTLLPLVLIGFAVSWYRRHVKAFEEKHRAERRAAQRQALTPERGQVLKAPEGYFERGYVGTPRGR